MSSAEEHNGPFHKIIKRIKTEREDGSDTNCDDSADTKTLQTPVFNRHPETFRSNPPTSDVCSLDGNDYKHKSFQRNKKSLNDEETEFEKGYESDIESDGSITSSDGEEEEIDDDDSSDNESDSTNTDPFSMEVELVEDLTLEEVCSNFIKRAQSERYYNGQSLHRLV